MSKAKQKNGKTSSQDYMNLMFTDSDSDDVPDLNLPPIKGKKPKAKTKRRSPSSQHQSVSVKKGCLLCSAVKIVVAVLLFGSIVALGLTSYWLAQQILDLKDQINTCREGVREGLKS